MAEVKLHGHWTSPFSYRVVLALALKDIPFEYIEEDLNNKSPQLLHYNPVYKKVPVLIHGGNSICESTIILQYIDEMWPENPLFPADPAERATARFWIQFAEEKGPAIWRMFISSGEEHEKAKQETLQILKIIEEQAIGDAKFFAGDKIGAVDLVYSVFAEWLGVFEEIIGEKLTRPDPFPRLNAWIKAFNEAPVISENRPDRDRMVEAMRRIRERLLVKPSSE